MITGRQVYTENDPDYDGDSWWYSDTAYVAKWAVLGGIFFIFFVLIIGGHFHAKSRMRKGLRKLHHH